MEIILQKIIAASGYCSRRKGEELIRAGRVKVNGVTAGVGEKADPTRDTITVDGQLLAEPANLIYIKLNKPLGYTCTNRIFPGENNIFELVNLPNRLFAVGRLDKNSRGLVLLTNDGSLTQDLTHPKFQHEKIYEVKIDEGIYKPETVIAKFKKGVDIGEDDGIVYAQNIQYLQNNLFIITLNEGKKRQIRRMFKTLGLEVEDLRRINLGGLTLGHLAEGNWAYLSPEEISRLKKNN